MRNLFLNELFIKKNMLLIDYLEGKVIKLKFF